MNESRLFCSRIKFPAKYTRLLGIIVGIGVGIGLGSLSIVSHVFTQSPAEGPDSSWTDTFPVEEFSSVGRNPYFNLKPGYSLVLEGSEDGKKTELTITVRNETRTVNGVETRVVEEREKSDGKLIEVSRNYFAIGKLTNSVYYFGEDVDIYRDDRIVSHEGAWLAGVKGARYGLMMPGIVLLGSRYCQEVAPGIAMDRAENISLTESVETRAGSFKNCLKVMEYTPLEANSKEFKIYAAGIGLIQDSGLKLVKHSDR